MHVYTLLIQIATSGHYVYANVSNFDRNIPTYSTANPGTLWVFPSLHHPRFVDLLFLASSVFQTQYCVVVTVSPIEGTTGSSHPINSSRTPRAGQCRAS